MISSLIIWLLIFNVSINHKCWHRTKQQILRSIDQLRNVRFDVWLQWTEYCEESVLAYFVYLRIVQEQTDDNPNHCRPCLLYTLIQFIVTVSAAATFSSWCGLLFRDENMRYCRRTQMRLFVQLLICDSWSVCRWRHLSNRINRRVTQDRPSPHELDRVELIIDSCARTHPPPDSASAAVGKQSTGITGSLLIICIILR